MSRNETPSLTELFRKAFKSQMSACHTSIPAVVISYNPANTSAKVKPVVVQRNEKGALLEYPVIGDIPVHFSGGNDTAITHPIIPGDFVWLCFAEVSIDDWLQLGGAEQVPSSIRRFQVSDAVAIPGIRPFSDPLDPLAHDPVAIVLYVPTGRSVKVGDNTAALATARADNTEALLLQLANHVASAAGIPLPPLWTPTTVPLVVGSLKLFTSS